MRALITKTLFVLSMMLSAQALAFDVGGFSYSITSGTTNVKVTGRAPGNTAPHVPGNTAPHVPGNTATDIVIPATVKVLIYDVPIT